MSLAIVLFAICTVAAEMLLSAELSASPVPAALLLMVLLARIKVEFRLLMPPPVPRPALLLWIVLLLTQIVLPAVASIPPPPALLVVLLLTVELLSVTSAIEA